MICQSCTLTMNWRECGARLCAGQKGTSRSIPNVATRCGWSSTQPRSEGGSLT
jgi:hypothetical protein